MNKNKFIRYLKTLPRNAKVLDAGCGTGNNSRYIHKIRPDLKIYGVDINSNLQKKVPKYMNFKPISVENLKCFKNGYFDCILCFHLIEHLRDPTIAISEFNRVLKRKGVIFAESPSWISTIMPIGYNFYDDPTHIRPYTKKSFKILFSDFSIKYVANETAIFFYLAELYNLNFFSLGYLLRSFLHFLGVYKTAIFVIVTKK